MKLRIKTALCIASLAFLSAKTLLAVGTSKAEMDALRDALKRQDTAAIETIVGSSIVRLGPKAGTPQRGDTFVPVPRDLKLLSKEEAYAAFEPFFINLEPRLPWKSDTRPERMTAPLRAVASVLSGTTAALRAGYDKHNVRRMAVAASEFLLKAQMECGADCYPFPAAKGTSSARAMEVATDFLRRAEKNGSLSRVVRNGWVFADEGDGGLQFDNGECGVAMWDWFMVCGDEKVKASALRATEWALTTPLVPNWNYNSFSVFLLARAYRITGDERFRSGAIRKAMLGVLAGQLKEGVRAGRWADPHNAMPAYHYLMVRALTEVAVSLRADDLEAPAILSGLRMALRTRNAELIEKGIMNKDKAFEALLLTGKHFSDRADLWSDTCSAEALHLLGTFISDEYRRGKFPMSPGEWCHFLEYVVSEQ